MTKYERAKQYVTATHSPSDVSDFQNAMNIAVYKGYVKGAEEQQEIDIEKACKWLYDNYLSEASQKQFVEDFKKAMEE